MGRQADRRLPPKEKGATSMTWGRLKEICGYVDSVLDKLWTVFITLGGALLTLTVVLQVFLRYVLKSPLFGLEEFSRLIGVWVYFLGAVFGTRFDSHVQGDVAARFFKTSRSRAVLSVTTWIFSLVLCMLFLYHSGAYSLWLYETGEKTTGLWWPRITSVGSMFFGAIFMTLYSIANVVKYIEQAITAPKGAEGGRL
jgi:TRAP-type C4-dicarboxylate transport system permease small subunit